MTKQPSLSVIMTNYNHSQFLPEALDAILSQSYIPKEFIIIDDASTDNSFLILQKYAERYPFIEVIKNKERKGAVHNYNTLLEMGSGEYVYGAAADDIIGHDFIGKSLKNLKANPQAGLCCSDPVTFNEQNNNMKQHKLHLNNKPCYFNPAEIERILVKKNPWIAGHTCIVRKKALKDAGNYIAELKWHCDWFAMLVIALRYGMCYIPESLASLRVSQTSFSASGTRHLAAQKEVLKNMLDILKSQAYRDVLPKFRHSAVLSCFGIPLLRVIFNNPEHKDFLTPLLLQRILWNETLRMLSPITPSPLKKLYHTIQER